MASVASAAALMLAGCGSQSMTAGNAAQVRLIVAAPTAPAMDFYANATPLAYGLGNAYSSTYVPVAEGTTTVTASLGDTRQVLATATAPLVAGRQYTALVSDTGSTLRESILPDQSTPAPAGESAVRLVNTVPRTGGVDVYLVPSGGTLAHAIPLVQKLGTETVTAYREIPAGTYAIEVVPAGTVPGLGAGSATLLTGAQTEYPAGVVRTLVLMPRAGAVAGSLEAMLVDDFVPSGGSE